jgi:DNA polymerase-3 subunit gamma/tau
MVTQQGFNALLKIVEEPPEHVKFIFATTEPDKVIGTIRSRTHHYPFRLVPPAELLSYVDSVCAQEGVSVEEGVLPLVVRAGGGSVRDTLSVLDQLIAGSNDGSVPYDRAVGLLGYTHGELLAEVVGAIVSGEGSESFVALDKVMQTGQDPRRFGEDLLEYLRDLIVVLAAGEDASSILAGVSGPVMEQMKQLAWRLGPHRLSEMADVVSEALQSMTGATSPRLHLELLVASLLLDRDAKTTSSSSRVKANSSSVPQQDVLEDSGESKVMSSPTEPLTQELLSASWPAVIESVAEKKRVVWSALTATEVIALVDDVVTIGFPSLHAAEVLKKPQGPGLPGNAELVREAILDVTGHRVRFKVQEISRSGGEPDGGNPSVQAEQDAGGSAEPEPPSWPTVTPPGSADQPEKMEESIQEISEDPAPAVSQAKVGEAVIREVLGGELVEEHPVSEQDER